jgi:hypothetical protein
MIVTVYRDAGSTYDCTAGGISSRATRLCLVNVDGPFEPSTDRPAAFLLRHAPFGHVDGKRMVRIVPAVRDLSGDWTPEPRWTMFGGNYAGCSDSRFSEKIEEFLEGARFHGAVAIHDRIEG